MRPTYLKATRTKKENPKEWQTGTGRDCAGTNNYRVTLKPDNPLKGIRNPINQNLDNTLKGIWNQVPNGIQIQWLRGLTIPT